MVSRQPGGNWMVAVKPDAHLPIRVAGGDLSIAFSLFLSLTILPSHFILVLSLFYTHAPGEFLFTLVLFSSFLGSPFPSEPRDRTTGACRPCHLSGDISNSSRINKMKKEESNERRLHPKFFNYSHPSFILRNLIRCYPISLSCGHPFLSISKIFRIVVFSLKYSSKYSMPVVIVLFIVSLENDLKKCLK